jgi:hypothetical protein
MTVTPFIAFLVLNKPHNKILLVIFYNHKVCKNMNTWLSIHYEWPNLTRNYKSYWNEDMHED